MIYLIVTCAGIPRQLLRGNLRLSVMIAASTCSNQSTLPQQPCTQMTGSRGGLRLLDVLSSHSQTRLESATVIVTSVSTYNPLQSVIDVHPQILESIFSYCEDLKWTRAKLHDVILLNMNQRPPPPLGAEERQKYKWTVALKSHQNFQMFISFVLQKVEGV